MTPCSKCIHTLSMDYSSKLILQRVEFVFLHVCLRTKMNHLLKLKKKVCLLAPGRAIINTLNIKIENYVLLSCHILSCW